jgi:hypothetical protein
VRRFHPGGRLRRPRSALLAGRSIATQRGETRADLVCDIAAPAALESGAQLDADQPRRADGIRGSGQAAPECPVRSHISIFWLRATASAPCRPTSATSPWKRACPTPISVSTTVPVESLPRRPAPPRRHPRTIPATLMQPCRLVPADSVNHLNVVMIPLPCHHQAPPL